MMRWSPRDPNPNRLVCLYRWTRFVENLVRGQTGIVYIYTLCEVVWWIWLSSSWGGTVQQLRGDVMGLFCRYCMWWSLWQVTAWVCLHPEIDRTSSTLERRFWSVLQNTLCSSNQNVWCSLMLSEGRWKCSIRKLHVTENRSLILSNQDNWKLVSLRFF